MTVSMTSASLRMSVKAPVKSTKARLVAGSRARRVSRSPAARSSSSRFSSLNSPSSAASLRPQALRSKAFSRPKASARFGVVAMSATTDDIIEKMKGLTVRARARSTFPARPPSALSFPRNLRGLALGFWSARRRAHRARDVRPRARRRERTRRIVSVASRDDARATCRGRRDVAAAASRRFRAARRPEILPAASRRSFVSSNARRPDLPPFKPTGRQTNETKRSFSKRPSSSSRSRRSSASTPPPPRAAW